MSESFPNTDGFPKGKPHGKPGLKSRAPELEPDQDDLVRIKHTLFRNARPDGYVALRIFSKDQKLLRSQFVRLDAPDFVALMVEMTRQAANWPGDARAVFSPPMASFRNHHNAKTDNLREGPVISVECDRCPVEA